MITGGEDIIYKFKNYYIDALLENQYELNKPFYTGNEKIIIISHEIYDYILDDTHTIFYYIKNNDNNIISFKNLYDEIDKQSLEYKSLLDNTDHLFIEGFDKKTDIHYVMCCLS
jgi:hypothetical protein